MEVKELMSLGAELGLAGAELRSWVDEERARQREERAADREAQRLKAESEQRIIELKIRLAEASATEIGRTDGSEGSRRASLSLSPSPHKLMPPFDDKRDDLDSYLRRFERVAQGQDWPQEKWATALSMCLVGPALEVIGRMSPEDSLDYDRVKRALLQRFRYTAEGYREKFRESKPLDGETGSQFAARLEGFFDRWVSMDSCPKTYEGIRDQMIGEQFLRNCHPRLAVFLKERSCKTFSALVEMADHFLEARGQPNLANFRKETKEALDFLKEDEHGSKPALKIKCFLCGKLGHKAADCRSKPETRVFCQVCQRSGHESRTCPQEMNGKTEVSCFVKPDDDPVGKTDAFSRGRKKISRNAFRTPAMKMTEKARSFLSEGMPITDGILNGKAVKVLRDSGSNTVIVRRELVASEDFTGKVSPVFLVDGTCLMLPEANIRLVSPFLTGQVTVKCMDFPLYDVIVGNIHGAKDSTEQTLKEVSDGEGEVVAAVDGSMPSRLNQLSNGGSARERGDLRLSQWSDTDAKEHLKSRPTTHEQYLEKEKLLQRVFDMKKPVYPNPRRVLYPRPRLQKRNPEVQTVLSPLSMTNNYPVLEIYPHDSVPTEVIEGYSLAGADLSVSSGEDTMVRVNERAKRKCQDGRQKFLERQVDREQIIKEEDLQLEERRFKLDEERLAFERTKFEAEVAVKVRRLDMEEKERRIRDGTDKMHLELMKKMFDELVRRAP